MSDYIGITEAQSNPFAPLTSELVKQLRDNPIAIAEGAEGAPISVGTWHPWDATTYGDSDGLIYDHAVDGSVTTVFTPVFDLGYEYRLLSDNLNCLAQVNVNISFRREGGAFQSDQVLLNRSSATLFGFDFVIARPMLLKRSTLAHGLGVVGSATQTISNADTGSGNQRVDQVRIRVGSGGTGSDLSSGRIWLYRRKAEGFE